MYEQIKTVRDVNNEGKKNCDQELKININKHSPIWIQKNIYIYSTEIFVHIYVYLFLFPYLFTLISSQRNIFTPPKNRNQIRQMIPPTTFPLSSPSLPSPPFPSTPQLPHTNTPRPLLIPPFLQPASYFWDLYSLCFIFN